MQHHLLQQAPKATGTSQAAWGPTPPSLAALSSSPAHRMQGLMLLPSRERERGKKKNATSSMTSCSNHTAQTPSALDHGQLGPPPSRRVEGSSAHLGEPSPKARPPARSAHPARQQCPIPAGRRLLPVPTTLANSPLGLQPEARLSLLLQSTETSNRARGHQRGTSPKDQAQKRAGCQVLTVVKSWWPHSCPLNLQ